MTDQPDSTPEDASGSSRSRSRSTRWNDSASAVPTGRSSSPREDRGERRRDRDDSARGFRTRDDRDSPGDGGRPRSRGGYQGRDERRDSRGGYQGRRDNDDRRGGRDDHRRRDERPGRDDRRRDDRGDRRGAFDDRGGRRSFDAGDDRRGAAEGTGQRGPRSWDAKGDERPRRAPEPELPESITGQELDKDVRQQLRTLSKDNADGVAKHLVAAAEFLDEDPERSLLHAQHAVSRAARVPAAREALGLVLYREGDFAEALREFRTARRLSGSDHLLPYMVDCERGLGRYERALELANSPEAQRLSEADNIELAIVVSGVRRDMGQARAAVVGLRVPALRRATTQPWAARLFYAYADALLDIGDVAEARAWFVKADKVDRDGETDAADRIDEIDGVEMTDLAPDEEESLDPRLAEIDLSKPFGTAPSGEGDEAR